VVPAFSREQINDLSSLQLKFEALQFWHVGAARTKADREAQAEARRRLLQKLLSSDSADLQPGG